MLFLNIFSSQFLLCMILFVLLLYCAAAFVLDVHLRLGASQYRSIYLCKHSSIHTFCKESEVISMNVNRCIENAYRYLRCIQVTTKTEFTANDKSASVLVTYNDCIKDHEMLWGFFQWAITTIPSLMDIFILLPI